MKGIENRITFDASPRVVFKHLANPQNIPLYVPGIRSATVIDWKESGVGTRVSLLTRHEHEREAYVTQEALRKFISIQDDHGTVNEWELAPGKNGGTVAVNRILGDFPDDVSERLAEEARAKLYVFKDIVDGRANGHKR